MKINNLWAAIAILFLLTAGKSFSQVAINTDASAPDNSAMLDVKSQDKGILIPRLTSAQKAAIENPANGLMVFDITTGTFWYFSASQWVEIPAGEGTGLSDQDGDTKVEVEKNPDEDIIRLSTGGVERMAISRERITTGLQNHNLILGEYAGLGLDSIIGNSNTVLGYAAFRNPYTTIHGISNVAIGDHSLGYFNDGNYNVAIGSYAMGDIEFSTGNNNVAIGLRSLSYTYGASECIAIGTDALGWHQGYGTNNIGIGYQAGYTSFLGDNVCMGYKAGASSMGENICIGRETGMNTGGEMILIGKEAGKNSEYCTRSVCIGYRAGYNFNGGSENIILGNNAGHCLYDDNLGGYGNVFLGSAAGYSTTYSNLNIFIGVNAGYSSQETNGNVYLGVESGRSNVDGNYNLFLGNESGKNETGSNKLYIANTETSNPLIYGEFDNSLLKFNGQVEVVNHDVYINDSTKGVIMTSPDGQCWQVKVQNGGSLSTAVVACP